MPNEERIENESDALYPGAAVGLLIVPFPVWRFNKRDSAQTAPLRVKEAAKRL